MLCLVSRLLVESCLQRLVVASQVHKELQGPNRLDSCHNNMTPSMWACRPCRSFTRTGSNSSSSSSRSWQPSSRPVMQPRHASSITAQAEQQQPPAEREKEIRQQVTRRIKQLGEQRKFKEAVQELASLAQVGVQPDTQAATALLAACTRSRDMKVAQSVFDQLFAKTHLTGRR
eukprot:GHRR01021972.1.p1 GENE.GHRR01021972.1~~GHRR01021972.1.p1  ORF type:complete len:174 (+),score=76.27 GHRR01021972.1:823-1344(+)